MALDNRLDCNPATCNAVQHSGDHVLHYLRSKRQCGVADDKNLDICLTSQVALGEILRDDDRYADFLFIHGGASGGFVRIITGSDPRLHVLVEEQAADVLAQRMA